MADSNKSIKGALDNEVLHVLIRFNLSCIRIKPVLLDDSSSRPLLLLLLVVVLLYCFVLYKLLVVIRQCEHVIDRLQKFILLHALTCVQMYVGAFPE